jgi:beta-catenin-like protein 1
MVEDEYDDDDGEAGPELPPDFEEDIPDDEEGRFFGGGMEQKTAQAMQYIDQNEEEEAAVRTPGIQLGDSAANKLIDL